MNNDLGTSYQMSGPVDSFTIVKFGPKTQDNYGRIMPTVTPATSSADVLIGISAKLPPQLSTGVSIDKWGNATPLPVPPIESGDVVHCGVAYLMLGDAVVNGDFITSDAAGHGVRAVAGDRVIAVALDDGAAGEVVGVVVQIGQLAAADAPSGRPPRMASR